MAFNSTSRLITFPILLILALSCSLQSLADQPTELPEMVVSDDEMVGVFESATGSASMLESTLGLLVSSQGGSGRQNDLSIRGSSFSGAGISINGISLDNPQTEHFNAELPLPAGIFHVPRVVTCSEQARMGDGNLVGSVELKLRPVTTGGYADLLFGERDRNRQSFLYERSLEPFPESYADWAVGAFALRERSKGRDYPDNDLRMEGGGGRLQYSADERQNDLVIGMRDKEFGARGYYGVSPDYYAEERIEDSLLLLSSRNVVHTGSNYRFNLLLRRIKDEYSLWLPSGLYRNRHTSRIAKTDMAGSSSVHGPIALDWLAFAANEDIDSDSLGDRHRSSAGAAILPRIDKGPLSLAGGLRAEAFRHDSPAWLPQLRVDCGLSESTHVYADYSETVRQPSYTELNYESPGSLGNADLQRQESDSIELGLTTASDTGMEASLAVFSRESRSSVDWVKSAEDARWTATDIGAVETTGLELRLGFKDPEGIMDVECAYQYLDKSNSQRIYSSRYMLDYARHLLQLRLAVGLTRELVLRARQDLRWQEPNALRAGSDFGAPARLELGWSPTSLPAMSIVAGADNLWNDAFQQIPGQRAYDRGFYISARWSL